MILDFFVSRGCLILSYFFIAFIRFSSLTSSIKIFSPFNSGVAPLLSHITGTHISKACFVTIQKLSLVIFINAFD